MSKPLSIGMIQMYVDMAEKEYNPLIAALQAKSEVLRDKIKTEVKKDFGIYNLIAEYQAINVRKQEIMKKLRSFHNGYINESNEIPCLSKVSEEVNRRIEALFPMLQKVQEEKDTIIKKIRLMGAGDDVKSVFEDIAANVAMLATSINNMPAIDCQAQQQLNS